ncbi:MAG: PRC-barrel domain-containing protein [Alphaproteobacteria bacterium]|nr:PRC-barrel domain-containing protein [Alphaproteobacteria bacterium]
MLATTALVALMATPVSAASPSDRSENTVYMMTVTTVGAADTQGYLASNVMGRTVYASNAEDAEAVGDVNDIVIGSDGSLQAVILGVGGFIGMGEKPVAISAEQVEFYEGNWGEIYVLVPYTSAELEGAKSYDAEAYKAEQNTVLLTPKS